MRTQYFIYGLADPHFIYGLADPRTGDVRYVGKSTNPKRRLAHHICYSPREKTHKANWIKQLLSLGCKPVLVILLKTSKRKWQSDERRIIREMRERGVPLTNLSNGGDGVDIPRTAEHNRKIGQAHKGKVITLEQRQKIRKTLLDAHPTCKRGHAWTPANTAIVVKDGRPYRNCRTCVNENARRRRVPKGRARKVCPQGHAYVEGNILYSQRNRDGKQVTERRCRTCVLTNNRAAARRAIERRQIRATSS